MTVEELLACDEYRTIYAACVGDYQEGTGWAALRDWLRDHGCPESQVQEADPVIRLGVYDIDRFLGSGIGSGIGIGRGIGIGIGRGIGSGSGIGIGRGSGIGSGIGIGRGIGSGIPFEVRQMEVGKCYLIHCGDWHTYVGRCVRQVGPQTYVLETVSKIAETNNGDCWHELAAGDAKLRKAATYAHYKTNATVPLAIAAFEWVGKLPQET